jgi:uncharacterized membrane protein
MRKILLWMLMGGMAYYALEGVWHIPINGGWANVCMLVVGGLCFVLVGGVNQHPKFYNLKMRWQALIGAVIVLVVEFFAGCVINLWLGMGVWDYTDMPLNILGQVCLPYGILWFLLMPLAIWLEDRLELVFYSYYKYEQKSVSRWVLHDYTLAQAYEELVKTG